MRNPTLKPGCGRPRSFGTAFATPWVAAGVAWLALLAASIGTATAQTPALFREADLELGQKLIAEHKCATCHARKVGGDGSAIYRPKGRIQNPGALRGMVDLCSTELNLGLFPEEVTAVAAVLNRDHYRFGAAGP